MFGVGWFFGVGQQLVGVYCDWGVIFIFWQFVGKGYVVLVYDVGREGQLEKFWFGGIWGGEIFQVLGFEGCLVYFGGEVEEKGVFEFFCY